MKLFTKLAFIVPFLLSFSSYADSNAKIIKIGTGNKSAVAYPMMVSMCETFNKYNLNKKVSCVAISTNGSEENMEGVIDGKYDAGVIKADMEYNAYNGIGIFDKKSYRDLRNIIGLHKEYLTILVKKNSNISKLQDFKNKRVYIGNKGSGSRIMVDKLFAEQGWKEDDFQEVHEEPTDQIYNLFCKDQIDAAIYLVGHPNSIFKKTMADCNVKMIGFSRKEIESYTDIFRHIYPATIKKGTYSGQNKDIQTFASQLLLATSATMDEETVYNFVQVISEYYDEIQKKNQNLRDSSLFSAEINSIPLHKGALRSFDSYFLIFD